MHCVVLYRADRECSLVRPTARVHKPLCRPQFRCGCRWLRSSVRARVELEGVQCVPPGTARARLGSRVRGGDQAQQRRIVSEDLFEGMGPGEMWWKEESGMSCQEDVSMER